MTGDAKASRMALAAYGALFAYFTAPILSSGDALGVEDWDALLFFHASVAKAAYEYGQLPFWNPWSCGGNVLWQNPQVALITPAYALAPFMSIALAMKLTVVLHYVIGFAGMHLLLTRIFKLTFWPLLLFLSSLFVLAGGLALHLTVGHTTFLPYFWLPLVLLLFLRAIDTGALRGAIGAAALVALGLYSGGVHVTMMFGLALTCFAAAAALTRRDWRPLALLGVVGILAVLFAAPKMIPSGLFVADPRVVDVRYQPPHPDRLTFQMFVHAYLDPFQYRRMAFTGMNYGWHEYGNFLGSFGVALMAASFVWIFAAGPARREHWLGVSLAGTAGLLLLLTLGEFGRYAPYVLMRRLPIFSAFRLPSRYGLILTLFGVAMIAWTIQASRAEEAAKAPLRRFVAVVLIAASFWLAYRNRVHFEGAFPLPPLESQSRLQRPDPPVVDAATDGFGSNSPMLRALAENRSVLRCNDTFLLPGNVDPAKPIVFSDHALIGELRFSPNRVEFRAQAASRPAHIFLNQRYVRGWSSSAGELTIDPQTGLASVTLEPGRTGKFAFRFVPLGLGWGFGLLTIGLAASVLMWTRSLPGSARRRGGQQSSE